MRFLFHADPDEDVYAVPIMYREMMSNDIMQINSLLDEAAEKVQAFPQARIRKENINFLPHREFDNMFTRFIYTPYTKTGKIAKYQYRINFHLVDKPTCPGKIFGNIYFTKDCQIGKAWIILGQKFKTYEINCAIKNNQLQVTRIDDLGGLGYHPKICLYNYNSK